ncbi:NACHT, LRR and PYD domains-containing protein 1a isoform X4 [Onychostoma macrolepis]|uniref:NACHT, LRR and PYD domains-containing protein 1a isoform X4 n=1 Tax=Onychostoma macrolepis TaxID=369639 RepID=UPI00272A90D0|nr:NACHT, LRR and PYD domains-containing protein 1a isoform X4 [Onychostoma macrolepis]
MEEARFETQQADTRRCIQTQNYITKDLRSKSEMEKSISTFVKTEDLIKKFEPELAVIDGKISYRFQWKTEGLFMCTATGLVFGLKGSGCVEYSVAHWDMRLLINTHYEPAGPLFDIKTPAGEIDELHLPHCETHVDAIGSLSVVHIHNEDTWEFLSPNRISTTHIVVNEPDMSPTQQRLWVFLLPSNVPLSEIKEQQQQYVFIQTSSDCKLQINAKYTLISKKAKRVQPKEKLFEPLHAGNHHPAFEVFLDKDVIELRIKIQLKIKESDTINFKNAWKRLIILKKNTDDHAQMRYEEHSNIQVNCKTWISALGEIMEDLKSEEFKKLKHLMTHTGKRHPICSMRLEETKERCELVTLVVKTWGFKESVKAIHEFMKELPRNDEFVTDRLKPYVRLFGLEG